MNNLYELIIIGAGPAGLSASIFAQRYGLNTLVLEKLAIGGQIMLTDRIENYPGFIEQVSGKFLSDEFKKHAHKFNAKIEIKEVKSINYHDNKFIVNTDKGKLESLSLIIATGSYPKKLNIKGEQKFIGRGVSYCATCDGPFFKDKDVIVIGGGNAAIEEALYLSNIAKSVKIIHRRKDLRAVLSFQKELDRKSNIELMLKTVPVEISGKDFVESLSIKNIKDNSINNIKCDGIFIFIGYKPNTDIFKGIVKLNKKGYILTNERLETSKKGIFAAGDVREKSLRQVITACSDGAIACDSVFRYISRLKDNEYSGW